MGEGVGKPIIVCEVEKRGIEHAVYNAALLETVLLAYKGEDVVFIAESAHVLAVRDALARASSSHMNRIAWREIDVPQRGAGFGKVMHAEWRWCRRILQACAANPPRLLLICSITDSGLLVLKMMMHARRTRFPIVAVPHSVLSTLALHQSPRFWRRFVNLRQVLRLPHPRSLRYVALGRSIHRFLEEVAPKAATAFRTLDLAYFWARTRLPDPPEPNVVRFGYFGVNSLNKGFDTFFELAEEALRKTSHSEFTMVGFVRDPADCPKYAETIVGVSSTPLSGAEFARRAESLTYAVWCGNPSHYRLTASASFLDALSYVKPGIYLRNPFIEHYFEQMGDIGHLCDTYEEMLEVILALDREFPAARYRSQCENILRGRGIFEPATLAPQLRAIVDECERPGLG